MSEARLVVTLSMCLFVSENNKLGQSQVNVGCVGAGRVYQDFISTKIRLVSLES